MNQKSILIDMRRNHNFYPTFIQLFSISTMARNILSDWLRQIEYWTF